MENIMSKDILSVDAKEFKEHFTEYIATNSVLAISDEEKTLGFYIPIQQSLNDNQQL